MPQILHWSFNNIASDFLVNKQKALLCSLVKYGHTFVSIFQSEILIIS